MLDNNITDNDDCNDDNTTSRDSFFADSDDERDSLYLQIFRRMQEQKTSRHTGEPGANG